MCEAGPCAQGAHIIFKSRMVPVRPQPVWSPSVPRRGGRTGPELGHTSWVGRILTPTLTSPLGRPQPQGQMCTHGDGADRTGQTAEGTQGCRRGGPLRSQPASLDARWPEPEGLGETALSASVITAGVKLSHRERKVTRAFGTQNPNSPPGLLPLIWVAN